MYRTSSFPEGSGVNPWYELSIYKEHKFTDPSEIKNNYDYVVVGAGFGGVSAAFRLSENNPSAKIALIDALPVGYYSSGRNAGFVTIAQVAKALIGFDHFTLDDQRWLLHLNKTVVSRIEKIREQSKLEFEWRQDGMYKAVREKRNVAALDALEGHLQRLGLGYERLKGDELSSRLGTSFYKDAIYVKDTILNNPSEVIRGLATALPSNVSVFENTKVAQVEDGAIPKVILSDGREIVTRQVILTVNAFLSRFGFASASNVAAIHSYGALTRELKDGELENFKNVRPWGITATHPSGATLRFTPDHRIFVRTDIDFATNLNISQKKFDRSDFFLRRAFIRRFPELENVEFEYKYGGLISFTGNTRPLFGEVAQNIYAGVTSDGTGVTRAAILGTYLADLIQHRDSSELDYIKRAYHPSYLPPEPLRTLGATAFLKYKDLYAGSEL